MSRWRNSSETKSGFSEFLKEAMDVAPGNPTGTGVISPAERARQLGLQSNGRGGYIDPNSGQVVAQTVNGELVFYSQNRASGGAVSDSSGGAALVSDAPSWADPVTGMTVTPPGKPETPEEQGSVPDPVPAKAPHGYNSFMVQKKQQAYEQDIQQQEQQVPEGDMDLGGQQEEPAQHQAFESKGTTYRMFEAQKPGGDTAKRMAAAYERMQQQKSKDAVKDAESRAQAAQQGRVDPISLVKRLGMATPSPMPVLRQRALQTFQQERRPKTGKDKQAAFDAAQDPKNAPGVDPAEYERQSSQVDNKDPVDKALDRTSPEALEFDETLMKQRQAKAISLAQQLENVKPDTSPVGRQELASAIAMMHALRNSATNTSGGDVDLFDKIKAVYPDMVSDKGKNDWYDTFIGQGKALRKNLGLGDDDIDDDWAVERTANRNRMDFIDPEDQQDFMQYTWDKLGDQVRKKYGSQLDSFNPADLTFARKSQLETMKKGIDNIVKEFGDNPEILPGLINAYMDILEQAGHLHRASLKQGDTEKGVEVQGKPVNQGPMKGFDIDYDDKGNPRMFSGGFLDGQNPRTSLGITADNQGRLGFDSHSLLMSPYFETGGKKDRYSIENKVSSLMGDAVESRELPEAKPENVPWRSIKGGPSPANARGGGIPVQELAKMISDFTGEDINFRLGVRPKMKKDGTPSNQYEPDQYTDEDKKYWGELLQSLIDERDDDDNPFFNFGDGPSFNGETMGAQDWINRVFDMANSGMDGESKHENKFTMGLRSKLRQFRLMQMLQQAKQKGPGELAKVLAKMKYMAKKQGITGDLDKGGYTLYQ